MATDPAVQAEVRRIIEDENCDYSTPQQVAAVIRVVSTAARAQAFAEAAKALERTHPSEAALVRGLGEETENA